MIPVAFTSSGSTIRGYFFPAITKPVIATVIFLQGFPGTEGDELICARLARAGVHVLTFNYRGTFGSEGFFSFNNAVADIRAARQYLSRTQELSKYEIDRGKIVLGGWSFGSGMVPLGAAQNPEIRKFFRITGRNFAEEARLIERDPEYAQAVTKNLEAIRSPNGPINFRDDLLTDLVENQSTFDVDKIVPQLIDQEILLIGGWDDQVIRIEDHMIPFYRSLVENEAKKVRIEAVQDDHEFSKRKDQLVQIIFDWLNEE
jgi:alpha/beta superfamily hydrolase